VYSNINEGENILPIPQNITSYPETAGSIIKFNLNQKSYRRISSGNITDIAYI
jgi:hypothetical protein